MKGRKLENKNLSEGEKVNPSILVYVLLDSISNRRCPTCGRRLRIKKYEEDGETVIEFRCKIHGTITAITEDVLNELKELCSKKEWLLLPSIVGREGGKP